MGRPEQGKLTLVAGLQATHASATARLMERIRAVDLNHAPKRRALLAEPGIKSESHLSEALRSAGKNFPVSWLPGYVLYDEGDTIAGEIASWRGNKVVRPGPVSLAARLERLERVLDRMGETGDFIRERAAALPDLEDVEP